MSIMIMSAWHRFFSPQYVQLETLHFTIGLSSLAIYNHLKLHFFRPAGLVCEAAAVK